LYTVISVGRYGRLVARAGFSDFLVIDIETVYDERRWQPPAVPSPAERPMKSSTSYGEGERPSGPLPFPPNWAQRVIAIGYARLVDHRLVGCNVLVGSSVEADPDVRERTLLEQFAELAGERATLVTFNGRGFDLPVIALRSLCHGVPQPWYYRDRNVRARYSDDGHLDLCDWLADHGATRSGSLDALTKLVGLPGKGAVDGSAVDGLYRAGDLAAIATYCANDVAQTALLFLRFRLMQGRISPEDYAVRNAELVTALLPSGS